MTSIVVSEDRVIVRGPDWFAGLLVLAVGAHGGPLVLVLPWVLVWVLRATLERVGLHLPVSFGACVLGLALAMLASARVRLDVQPRRARIVHSTLGIPWWWSSLGPSAARDPWFEEADPWDLTPLPPALVWRGGEPEACEVVAFVDEAVGLHVAAEIRRVLEGGDWPE